MNRTSIALAVFLVASPAAADVGASYKELIFCARWAAGLQAVFREAGEDKLAEQAGASHRYFGYRALSVTPQNELLDAERMVRASNDAVTHIILTGTEDDWNTVSQKCAELR